MYKFPLWSNSVQYLCACKCCDWTEFCYPFKHLSDLMHQKKGEGAVKHTGAALDLYHSADSRTWEGRGSREDVMLFTAQQVIIWSPGITWFCNQAFIFEWHCVKAITPIWQSNKKMDSDWKLICLIDLKRKKIATFFFVLWKKKW